MTTQTTATKTVVRTAGRPLSDRARRTKNAVERFLENNTGTFTAADVRKVSKQSKVSVRNRLNALEREGRIQKVDQVSTGKRGRPLAVYTKAEAPKENRVVKANRAFIRTMSGKTFDERAEYVAEALITLYQYQLDDEKAMRDSRHTNGRGFTKYDALRGTNDAANIEDSGVVTVEQVNYWLKPVSKDGRARIQKYAGQLQEINEKLGV